MSLSSIEEGLEEIRNGRMVILVDEDAPESDGFFCLAAEKVTAQAVNYMLRYGRGIVYVTLVDERIRELGIPMVPEENSRLAGLLCGASFSISLEGVHGVSAQGRAHTIQAAIADTTKHEISSSPAMCSRCRRAAAVFWHAQAEPMHRWIWRTWPASSRRVRFVRSSPTTDLWHCCPG
jgi:3,4-dihydroxy 2-butanone 4-phosphate synthase / GTP cyclohydrolase II